MKARTFAWVALALMAVPPGARAEWPYLTEEAGTLPLGRYSVSVGVSQSWQHSRLLRGGEGVLWTLPEAEVTLGVGPHAEVSARYEILWFHPADGAGSTYESGDLRLWTKLAVLPGTLRGVSFRFGVKLPNASERHGLGTDETDAFLEALWGLRLWGADVSLNAGLGLLGATDRNRSQDDVFTWGGAVRRPLGRAFRVGLDAAGYSGPYGMHRKRDFATVGLVLDWCTGDWRVSLGARRGVQDALGWGWVAGVTWSGD